MTESDENFSDSFIAELIEQQRLKMLAWREHSRQLWEEFECLGGFPIPIESSSKMQTVRIPLSSPPNSSEPPKQS